MSLRIFRDPVFKNRDFWTAPNRGSDSTISEQVQTPAPRDQLTWGAETTLRTAGLEPHPSDTPLPQRLTFTPRAPRNGTPPPGRLT